MTIKKKEEKQDTSRKIMFKSPLFPSAKLIERLHLLPHPNTQPTELIGKPSEIIAKISIQNPISIILSKGMSDEEKNVIRNASKINGSQIEIFEGLKVEKRERLVLRKIDEEFLDNDEVKKTFLQFLDVIRQRDDLLEVEYNTHTLKHNSEITNPLDAHYLNNLGLNLAKDGEDDVRTKMMEFVQKTLKEVGNIFDGIIDISPSHNHLDKEQLKQVLMFGLLSNFLRGGVFYGFREGQNMSYEPRKIARDLIKGARGSKKK